ncbi:MAG: rod shape-determining protein MreD [Mycobacterium leprae]
MRYWVLAGMVVIAFLLQSVVSAYLALWGVTPDFLLVLTVTYGLLFGWRVGLGAGALGGLLTDLTSGRLIGLHVLALSLVGLLAGLVEERVFKDNRLLPPVAGFIGAIVGQTVVLLCLVMFGWQVPFAGTFRYSILPAAVYDMFLASLIYGRIYKYYLYLRPDPRGTIVIRKH